MFVFEEYCSILLVEAALVDETPRGSGADGTHASSLASSHAAARQLGFGAAADRPIAGGARRGGWSRRETREDGIRIKKCLDFEVT